MKNEVRNLESLIASACKWSCSVRGWIGQPRFEQRAVANFMPCGQLQEGDIVQSLGQLRVIEQSRLSQHRFAQAVIGRTGRDAMAGVKPLMRRLKLGGVQMGVKPGGFEADVAEHGLNMAQIASVAQQSGGKRAGGVGKLGIRIESR